MSPRRNGVQRIGITGLAFAAILMSPVPSSAANLDAAWSFAVASPVSTLDWFDWPVAEWASSVRLNGTTPACSGMLQPSAFSASPVESQLRAECRRLAAAFIQPSAMLAGGDIDDLLRDPHKPAAFAATCFSGASMLVPMFLAGMAIFRRY